MAITEPWDLPATGRSRKRHGWLLPVALTLLAIIVAAGIGAGAFFGGRATRQSDTQVESRIAAAKSSQARADRSLYTAKTDAALAAQKKRLKRLMKRRVAAATDTGYTNGQAQGYASGHATGQAEGEKSGHASGRRQGRREGYASGALDGYVVGYGDGSGP